MEYLLPIVEEQHKYYGNNPYNQNYADGQRYCQNATCKDHLHTLHFAQMRKLDPFIFCCSNCKQEFYQRNIKRFELVRSYRRKF